MMRATRPPRPQWLVEAIIYELLGRLSVLFTQRTFKVGFDGVFVDFVLLYKMSKEVPK